MEKDAVIVVIVAELVNGEPHDRLPASGVFHRCPGLGRGLCLAFLEKLDGDVVGRADKGHAAIARWPVDGHSGIHEMLAGGVDVIHIIGQMPKISAAGIFLGVPVVGQFQLWRARCLCALEIGRGCEKDEGEPARLDILAVGLNKAELVAVEIE
uniref:Predicted lactoylglutathione lyase n=1 Tax=uncultured bacterium MedeBAC46A06 TaxID=332275 RepID=Q4PJC4_9BACT|nr:predicted lactoylglutathione lyase [uncultured bacterium MedeBAC46A06]